jgi:hypothetical protein
LIKALPGIGSVSTFQQATVGTGFCVIGGRLGNGSYNRTAFSVWSVPWLYTEISRITEVKYKRLKFGGRSSIRPFK